eukprot:CAMPEP_0204823750 /NCGR_PEP_ID=MMETSP1346-20131115/1832_1 /ASSEMBLY_ACC=CAM_ASM_000771 /TAXON_ID=215587 /ORGANISM="Aplanochytrium stocchinoi, Strain GSBS06" /LENGTH=424 /DNA_ID=CAMNT_0051950533 /DNA_START=116 /DNA_END=1391 /DNA_ORIENTATION=-
MRALVLRLCGIFQISIWIMSYLSFTFPVQVQAEELDLKSAIQHKLKLGSALTSRTLMRDYDSELENLIEMLLEKETNARQNEQNKKQMEYMEREMPGMVSDEELHLIVLVMKLLKMKEGVYAPKPASEPAAIPKPENSTLSEQDEKILLLLVAHKLKEEIQSPVTIERMKEIVSEEDLRKLLFVFAFKERLMSLEKESSNDSAVVENMKGMSSKLDQLTEDDLVIILILLGLKDDQIEREMTTIKGNGGVSDEDLKILLLIFGLKEADKLVAEKAPKDTYVSDEDLELLLLLVGLKEADKKAMIKNVMTYEENKKKPADVEGLLYKFFFLAGLKFNMEFCERYNITTPPLSDGQAAAAIPMPGLSDFNDEGDIYKVLFIAGLKYNLNLLDTLNLTVPLDEAELEGLQNRQSAALKTEIPTAPQN